MTEIFFFFFLPTSPDPPLPIDFKCETHDLRSAVCQWGKGRDTHLYGSQRGTRYFVNNRYAVSLTKGSSRTVQSLIHRKHLQVLEYMDITGNLYLYFSNNPTSVQTCPNRMLDVFFFCHLKLFIQREHKMICPIGHRSKRVQLQCLKPLSSGKNNIYKMYTCAAHQLALPA